MPHRLPVPGDHLRVLRAGYFHHAIFAAENLVLHYTDVRPDKRLATIRADALDAFTQGSDYEVVDFDACDEFDVVLARAWSRVGENAYDLTRNNCEHFARWCQTGESVSDQVRRAQAAATGAAGSAALAAAGVSAVSSAGLVAGLSGPGVMSGLGAIGGTFGLGAAGGVGVLAAAPGLAATAAVRHAFRDDPALAEPERNARQSARVAGTAGAAAGTLGALGLVAAVGTPGLSAAGITSGDAPSAVELHVAAAA